MPTPIDFSKFSNKPSELSGTNAKKVKETLSENLKAYIVNKVPENKKRQLGEKLKSISLDLDSIKDKPVSEVINILRTKHFREDTNIKKVLAGIPFFDESRQGARRKKWITIH